ncbi:dihydropteroate synthase [Pseudothermotoga thermarum]|uniref:dihydropteroate synthase n=1 Tax=Pseudothermotoga thermarum DSM 5069 TaxID=688269 RepID=F7YV55_9THEM|nr:dihydropteroate synthase [Pseudothermotoga thermarum]AEH50354.1 dihydropteroate synthase [Pseudothermotoga thermarum DSM 5069]
MSFLVTKLDEPLAGLDKIGVDPASIPIFQKKGQFIGLLIYDVPVIAANVIKQEMLAAGGDAAVHRSAITHKIEKTNVLTLGTLAQHDKVIRKLAMMPYWGLDLISQAMKECLYSEMPKEMPLPNGKKLVFDRTLIMGIVNVTPDSFYAASRVQKDQLLDYVAKMVQNGVDIVDIGGESTRPGSDRVPLDEELNRVLPAIELVKANFDVIISVDTYKSKVAEEALKLGVHIVNDISALRFDGKMLEVVLKYKPAVILMHMKGEPKTMQQNPYYEDVVKEILEFFVERISLLKKYGLDDRVIIDPGIGFGKRFEDNIEILKRLDQFKSLKVPLLIGHSRKSFIGHALGGIPAEERLFGTLAVTAYCVMKKVNILRVHDVAENLQIVKMISQLI